MHYDFVLRDTETAKKSYTERVEKLFKYGGSTNSVFCLGQDTAVVTKNLKIFFSVMHAQLTALGWGFTRSAETEIIRAYKQKYTDRVTLNAVSSVNDVIAIKLIAGSMVAPLVAIQHYHGNKLTPITNKDKNSIVLPVSVTLAALTNTQEAYNHWSKVTGSATSVHKGMRLEELQETQKRAYGEAVEITPKPVKASTTSASTQKSTKPKLTLKKTQQQDTESDFIIPSNVSHEADVSAYFKPRKIRENY